MPILASKEKNEKNQFLQNTEKGKIDFHICFKVPIGPTDHAKKVRKKWGAHGFFGLAVKSEEIWIRPFWGYMKAKIKIFFSHNSLSLYTLKMA